ncbi:AAA family ATPase [Flavobacterium restrictum]|uniref:AAA family ATPase n=1 Tax=Flavobacterium restrictum TaxID=2594428 RepID=A0A553E656_9FLAO|nr:AAA family ATPase [Flavobacterium restrictum]TRX40431.1 AAA family ATPase [Flavobacterium restrictum]
MKIMAFNASFIQELREETSKILAICAELNKENLFIQKINQLVVSNNSNGLLSKAEHFFISDCIAMYNLCLGKEDDKARFTLAYYYDALRNASFADEKEAKTLNKLVSTENFKKHISKIKNENSLLWSKPNDQKYFIPSVLLEIKNPKHEWILDKYQNFLQHSYDIIFKDKKNFETFIGLKATVEKIENSDVTSISENDSLEIVLQELEQLIGLEEVKKDVYELINLLEIQKKRSFEGLKNIDVTLHTVFLGPPGTGKTSVARLLSRIFKHLGFLSKGQMYETDREGMVAGYVGQTASKVDKVVEESLGGVLFIDEAYALTQNAIGNDYGSEAVNTLLKRMEDHRGDLAVVVAGYTEPMKDFVESNPGLRSRFNRFFRFNHFSPEQLFLIFENFCKSSDFVIDADAEEKLTDTFELLHCKKDENFGNARVVRNLFEKCVQNQANRIVNLPLLNQEILKTFTEVDIPEPTETQKQASFFQR